MDFKLSKASGLKKKLLALMLVALVSTPFSYGFDNSNSDKEEEDPQKTNFWVVNFGTARTIPVGVIGFAAGVGGQMVFVGEPRTTNAFFTIPHAGLRYGLGEKLDVGLRLAPIPLPFSKVGPAFGANVDFKYTLSHPMRRLQTAVVLGAGGAHVLLEDENRLAYSPNVALLVTYEWTENTDWTAMGRHVNLVIPTAPEGGSGNYVNISGISLGLRKSITPTVSLLPEVGVYWYDGEIAGERTSGPGFQYGIMLATSF